VFTSDNKTFTKTVQLIGNYKTYHEEVKTDVVHYSPPLALPPVHRAPMVPFLEIKAARLKAHHPPAPAPKF
jgi:hypothetical protein